MLNFGNINSGFQIYNLSTQMLNLVIQMLNIGKMCPIQGMNNLILKQQIYNYGIQIQNLSLQMNNMNYNNMQINNMNNMQMNNINNIQMNNDINQIFNINNHNNNVELLLQNEFLLCKEDQFLIHIGTKFELINNNQFEWKLTMQGPIGTPYEDGYFFIKISFPEDFPNHGAVFKFINKIYHFNIDSEENTDFGRICYPFLNQWKTTGKVKEKPNYNVREAIYDIYDLLYKPTSCIHSGKMSELYFKDRKKFDEEAKEYVKKYASNEPESFRKRIKTHI